MADNNEKVLPVLRLLLIAFFALLLALALQLLLVVRANSTMRVQGVHQQRVAQNPASLHGNRFSVTEDLALSANRD